MNAQKFLLFGVGGVKLALSSSHVRRTLPIESRMPVQVLLSGRPFPVLDLRQRFGLGPSPVQERAIVLVETGGRRVALAVDSLHGVEPLDLGPAVPLPWNYRGPECGFIAGLLPAPDGTVTVLLQAAGLAAETPSRPTDHVAAP